MSATDKLSSRDQYAADAATDCKVESDIEATLAFGRRDTARRAAMAAAGDALDATLSGQQGGAVPAGDGDQDARIAELQEIADGAYGDGPRVRGAARDELARLAERPAPAGTEAQP